MYKLITLNIEGDRHVDTVISLLREQNADIICLQEVYEPTVSILREALGEKYSAYFEPICLHNDHDASVVPRPLGMVLFSRVPIREKHVHTIYSPHPSLQLQKMNTVRDTTRTLIQKIELDDKYGTTICNTHFTWSPRGEASENQRVDVNALISMLDSIPHFVLCGDFNIPRGNIHYQTLRTHFTDHIPATVTCSLDMTIHKAKHDPIEKVRVSGFMVDYIFSKPNTYTVTDVAQHCGMSDHCAFSAHIEKIS